MSDVRPEFPAELERWARDNLGAKTVRSGDWMDFRCHAHEDKSASASIRLSTGWIICQCCGYENWHDKYAREFNLPPTPDKTDKPTKTERKKRKAPTPPAKGYEKERKTRFTSRRLVASYPYPDAQNQNFVLVDRLAPKEPGGKKGFVQYHWDGSEWVKGLETFQKDGNKWEATGKTVKHVLYRLPKLLSLKDGDVLFNEGEKDVETAERLGFVATTTPAGAGHSNCVSDWSALEGKRVFIIPDNDEAGQSHALDVAKNIQGIATEVRIVNLPGLDEKGDLTDWVEAGGTREKLIDLIKKTPVFNSRGTKDEKPQELPEIVTNGRRPREVDEELASIIMEKTELYVMERKVVQIVEDQAGRKFIAEVTSDDIEMLILDLTVLVKKEWRSRKQEYETTPHRPNASIIRQTLKRLSTMLPLINRVTDLPFVTRGGEIVYQEGFHEESGTYLFPFADFDIKKTYSEPEVEAACKLLLEKLLGEFWFADHTSRVHAFCACLHYFLVDLIAEPTPAYMFAANRPNCGKTYLAQCIARIVEQYGAKEILESSSKQNDELEKKTNSHLLNGEKIILIDNVASQLRESWLHGYLTAHTLSVRVLSKSKIVSMPNKHLWFITANTPKLCTDITRRTVPVNLYVSPLIEDPSDRDFRKEAKDWAESHRKELVEACLTIISSWLKAGAKKSSHKLGSYPRWARIMGGICQHVGLKGFLETQKRHLQEVDEGAKERREVLRAMVETKGMVRHEDANFFYEALEKANALPGKVEYSNRPEKVRIREMGRYLTDMARMNPIAGDYKLTRSKCAHRKINLYSIELTSCSIEALGELRVTPSEGYPQNEETPAGLYIFSRGVESSSLSPIEFAGNPEDSAGNLRVTSDKVTRKEKPHNQADCENLAGNPGNLPFTIERKENNIYKESDSAQLPELLGGLPPKTRVTRNPSLESVRLETPGEPPKADRGDRLRHPEIQKKLKMADRWERAGNHESAARIRAEVDALIGSSSPPPPRPSPTPPEPDPEPPRNPDEGKSGQDLLEEAFDGSEPLF